MNARATIAVVVALAVGYLVGAMFHTPGEVSAWRAKARAAEEQREIYRQKAELLEKELAEIIDVLKASEQ